MKLLYCIVLVTFCFSQKLIAEKVSENIYMIKKSGGNIGVLIGDDGVFMIDDQFSNVSTELKREISKLSKKPIKYLINTHFHGDHTGGNENFGNMGATIVAHKNVRKRLSTEQLVKFFKMKTKATKKSGLPTITFGSDIQFYINNEEIDILHTPNAHTDGDAVVFFKTSNVVHLGDMYFSEMYPFFDVDNGGNIKGIIKGLKKVLSLIDDKTVLIPGHGNLSNKAQLAGYVDMLETLSSNMETLVRNGLSLSEIQSKKLTKMFDERFGKGFIKPSDIIFLMYESFTNKK